jgi:hypothetical protein
MSNLFSTTSQLIGKVGTELSAKGHMSTDVTRTGGRVGTPLVARGTMQTRAQMDAYRYTNFEAKAHMRTSVEVHDAQGRIKWAEDECM